MMMTKKLMLGTAIAAAMASAPVMAGNHGDHSSKSGIFAGGLTDNAYVAASVGFGEMALSDDAVIGSLVYGKSLNDYVTNLGMEVEVTGTLADAETKVSSTTYEGSYMSVGTYATYSYNLGDNIGIQGLGLFGKVGVAFNDYEYDLAGVAYDDSDVELGYGVGVNYNLKALTGSDQLGVRAEWADNGFVDEIKVGVSYTF